METSPDQIIAYYDEFYRTEGFRYYPPEFTRAVLSTLLRKAGLAPGARILDVGCATGYYSAVFRSMGYEVTGIDISATGIEKARQLHPDIRFEVMDATALDFPTERFDAIFALGVSVANTREPSELHAFLTHLHGFLAPGGTLLFLGGSNLSGGTVGESAWIHHRWEDIRRFPPPSLSVQGPWLTHFRLMKFLGPSASLNACLTRLLRLFGHGWDRRIVMLVR